MKTHDNQSRNNLFMSQVKLISLTPDAEKTIAYCARVSNPKNQTSDNYSKLLKYCIDHKHFSIFEQAFLTIEINTNRGIAAQILRHRSFTFQEFSQRYADTSFLSEEIPTFKVRRQDEKNRQNSIDDVDEHTQKYWEAVISNHFKSSKRIYDQMINDGIAKECARFILPLATPTRLFMSGTIRSWIHYIDLRSSNGTQKEHMDIANKCKEIFVEHLPTISEALGWK
jgi:thymidylate synthase (FAD)